MEDMIECRLFDTYGHKLETIHVAVVPMADQTVTVQHHDRSVRYHVLSVEHEIGYDALSGSTRHTIKLVVTGGMTLT